MPKNTFATLFRRLSYFKEVKVLHQSVLQRFTMDNVTVYNKKRGGDKLVGCQLPGS